jgi:hypothetical protein
MFTNLEDLYDVRVLQTGHRFGLSQETLPVLASGKLSFQQHFESDDAVQFPMSSPIDHPHAASANLRENLVIADPLGWLVLGGSRGGHN